MENGGMNNHIFSELVSAVYGNTVDEREIWDSISKSGGSMPKDASLKEARTGQALNVVATVGALNALRMAVPEYKHAKSMPSDPNAPKPKPPTINQQNKNLSPVGRKFKAVKLAAKQEIRSTPGLRAIAKNPRKAAIVATAGAVGLHSTELLGDAIAARSLHRSAQRAKLNQQQKSKIKKDFSDLIEARREGLITTEEALEIVEKGMLSSFARGFKAIPKLRVKTTKNNIVTKPPKGPSTKTPRAAIAPAAPTKGKAARNVFLMGAGTGAAGTAGYMAYRNRRAVPPNPTVAKSDNGMVWTGEISKIDGDKRQVFGWCSLTSMNGEPVVDLQGDYVPLEEIEKAAYEYVIHSRKGGDMHARDGEGPKHTADLIESFLVTPEKLKQMGLADNALPHGWWIGMKVNDDEQWNLVKSGGRTGFSIHGKGSRIEKML